SRHRDYLWMLCSRSATTEREANKKFGEHLRLASQVTDLLWNQLPASLPKRPRREVAPINVTFLGDASAPANVTNILQKGPKFSLAPRPKHVEKLCLVRTLAEKAGNRKKKDVFQKLSRLEAAGFPPNVLRDVSETLVKKIKKHSREDCEGNIRRAARPAVLPYLHRLSHNLK
ncbi:hypothetical protein HPB47_016311, partial [Ixodes persulcatus]